MKKRYKIIIICFGIILFLVLGIYGGLISGGSYSYSQQYEFSKTDTILIKAIENFKNENPEFRVPNTLNLPDSYNNYKYHFYIYYSKENKLIHCFIMASDNSRKSSIYLDAINNGLKLVNWKFVNRDYDRSENLKAKTEFRKRVLDKLKLPYEDEGNSMFIFWK